MIMPWVSLAFTAVWGYLMHLSIKKRDERERQLQEEVQRLKEMNRDAEL